MSEQLRIRWDIEIVRPHYDFGFIAPTPDPWWWPLAYWAVFARDLFIALSVAALGLVGLALLVMLASPPPFVTFLLGYLIGTVAFAVWAQLRF